MLIDTANEFYPAASRMSRLQINQNLNTSEEDPLNIHITQVSESLCSLKESFI